MKILPPHNVRRKVYIFHIGLPKTASTFLQHKIFEPSFEERYFHWKKSDHVRLLRKLAQRRGSAAEASRVTDWLLSLGRGEPLTPSMITCENISSELGGFWDGSGPSPAEVGDLLCRFRDRLPVEKSGFRIILGVRSQDQMLGSRYSEGATQKQGFTQSDFERRFDFILSKGSELPGHQWLYYDSVKDDLDARFGAENVFIFTQEALKADPKSVLARMSAFCSCNFDVALEEAAAQKKLSSVNRKSVGEDRWRLGAEELVLRPDLKQRVLAHFENSNARFTAQTGYAFSYP